jgi:hypothetical protein
MNGQELNSGEPIPSDEVSLLEVLGSVVTGIATMMDATVIQIERKKYPSRTPSNNIKQHQDVNNGAIWRCSSNSCITVSPGRSAIRFAASSTLGMSCTSPAVQMNTSGRASAQ